MIYLLVICAAIAVWAVKWPLYQHVVLQRRGHAPVQLPRWKGMWLHVAAAEQLRIVLYGLPPPRQKIAPCLGECA